MRGRVWVAGLMALGCGEIVTVGNDGGVDAAPGSLVGVKNDLHVTEGGLLSRPVDFGGLPVRVLVEGGDPIEGTGDADGHFEVPDVPSGEVVLQVGETYLVTSERDIDLSRLYFGRPDRAIGSAGTRLELSLTGLDSYTADSYLQVAVVNTEGFFEPMPPPDPGATAVSGVIELENSALLDAAEGDVFRLTHTALLEDPDGAAFRAVVQAFQASVTSPDREVTTVAGNLTPVTRDQELMVDLRVADYTDHLAALTGAGEPQFAATPSFTLLGGRAIENYDTGIVTVATLDAGAAGPVAVRYGNPFADQALFEQASLLAVVDLDPDPDVVIRGIGLVSESGALGELSQAPIRPALGPVAGITADGVSLQEPQTISATAELAWEAPALGTPDIYAVLVRAVPAAGRGDIILRILTPHPSARIPAGALEPGARIYIEIIAHTHEGFSPRQPDLNTGRASVTQVPTAILTVGG